MRRSLRSVRKGSAICRWAPVRRSMDNAPLFLKQCLCLGYKLYLPF